MLRALYHSLRHLIVSSCTRILRPPVNRIKDLAGSGSNTVSFLNNSTSSPSFSLRDSRASETRVRVTVYWKKASIDT